MLIVNLITGFIFGLCAGYYFREYKLDKRGFTLFQSIWMGATSLAFNIAMIGSVPV